MKCYLVVINGLGIGELPDASKFDSVGVNTLSSISSICTLPNLGKLGLYNIFGVEDQGYAPIGMFSRAKQISNSVGFATGLREILGKITFNTKIDIELSKYSSSDEDLLSLLACNKIEVVKINNLNYIKDTFSTINKLYFIEYADFANKMFNRDYINVKDSLMYIDSLVGEIITNMDTDDLIIVVGNQGIKTEREGVALAREYVPYLLYIPRAGESLDMGSTNGLDSIAMTIADYFGIYESKMSSIYLMKKIKEEKIKEEKKNGRRNKVEGMLSPIKKKLKKD